LYPLHDEIQDSLEKSRRDHHSLIEQNDC
jgi:hypothetical protein